MQGELDCAKQSARCDERSAKRGVSGLERTKLIKVVERFSKTWSWEGKLLLAFCMVSTVIKYKMLCHVWAMWRFCREPHDMVICKKNYVHINGKVLWLISREYKQATWLDSRAAQWVVWLVIPATVQVRRLTTVKVIQYKTINDTTISPQ